MSNKDVKEAIENYLRVIARQTEEKCAEGILEALISASKPLDKLSISMLVVSGATATLSIGNAADVVKVIGTSTLAWMLALLVFSALLGFVAKISATIAEISLSIRTKIIARLTELIDGYERFEEGQIDSVKEHTDLDTPELSVENVFSSFFDGLPKFAQRRLDIEKMTSSDNKSMFRWGTTSVFAQVILMFGQSIFLLAAFVVAFLGID